MKARLLVLPLVIAAILSVVAIPIAAEWTYDLEVKLTYAPYTYRFEKGYVTVATFDDANLIAYVRVFDTNLSEVLSCSVSVNGAPTAHVYNDSLIVLVALNGNGEDVFFINASDCSIIQQYPFSPAGDGYVQTMGLEVAGGYIYHLFYDSSVDSYFLNIYNATGYPVNGYELGSAAVLGKVRNSGYLILWNGTSYINITDGSAGDLVTVDTIELGLSDLAYAMGWYDPSENAVYIAFANSTGIYLVKRVVGSATEWVVVLDDDVGNVVSYVGPASEGVYVVTLNNYGYRVIDNAVRKEYIPPNAFGHTIGSEYLFSIDVDNYVVYRWYLETAAITETTTVTETVTQTVTEVQYLTETETETIPVTTTVQGPYTSTDLVIVGLICLLLGAAVAYLARR